MLYAQPPLFFSITFFQGKRVKQYEIKNAVLTLPRVPLVIKPATYHYQMAAPNLVWVDPVTLGILAKLDIASSK